MTGEALTAKIISEWFCTVPARKFRNYELSWESVILLAFGRNMISSQDRCWDIKYGQGTLSLHDLRRRLQCSGQFLCPHAGLRDYVLCRWNLAGSSQFHMDYAGTKNTARNSLLIQLPKATVLFRQSPSITENSLDLQRGAGKVGETWPEHHIPART